MQEIIIILQTQRGIKKFSFNKDVISIGRAKENDIVLDDETVSNFHASITYDPNIDFYVLMDLDSKNGTFVGDKKIIDPYILEKFSIITIGKNKLQIFPTELKGGSKTVSFNVEEFKKTIPENIKNEIEEEEKIPTIPIPKLLEKEKGEKTLLEPIKERQEEECQIIFLEGEHKGRIAKIEKRGEGFLFGRSRDSDFIFSDQRISREHFKIFYKNDKWYIKNLKPINPVYLNNEEISQKERVLEEGSIISVQKEKIKFEKVKPLEKPKEPRKIEIQKELTMEIKNPIEKVNYYILKGPLNIDYYYKLENHLLSSLSPSKKWAIIDFKGVSLIDYPALASLLKIIAEYTQIGGEIILINISEELEKVFELVNVSRYLSKFKKQDLKESLDYLRKKIN